MGNFFPSRTEKWSFQDHLRSKTITVTQRARFPRRPEQ